MYCGNKYWNVQKNVGEQQEVKTLYYKVMYWKVLVRPRLRGLVGAQGSRTLLRGHALDAGGSFFVHKKVIFDFH